MVDWLELKYDIYLQTCGETTNGGASRNLRLHYEDDLDVDMSRTKEKDKEAEERRMKRELDLSRRKSSMDVVNGDKEDLLQRCRRVSLHYVV